MTEPELAPPGAHLAVLGSPIAHSRSPRIHAAAYELLGLPWQYEAIECRENELAGFIAGLAEDWRGLSLTMPLKEEARRIASVLDPVAKESGVVNTLLRMLDDSDGRARWAGFNTDVGGLAAAITEAGLNAWNTVVIGSGATAVSAILSARRLGARRVQIVARNASAIGELVARFDGSHEPGADAAIQVSGAMLPGVMLPEAVRPETADSPWTPRNPEVAAPTLVISTLPGAAGRDLDLPPGLLGAPLFDVAYDPWPSPLAERWRNAGGEAHAGIGMLVQQALLQIRIFVGGDPSIALENESEVLAAMRAAV